MRLIELVAENFKRLKACHIRPTGPLTAIVGKNGAGKTSVLDAIASALGGASYSPEVPIRLGEDYSEVVVDLGEIRVSRVWRMSEDGKVRSVVQVLGADGAKFPSPQSILDRLYDSLGFDPLTFQRLPPGQQAVLLARIAGLDLEHHQRLRAGVFDQRTDVNRQAKAAAAQLAGMPSPDAFEAVPAEEVSTLEVADRLQAAQEANGQRLRLRDEAERIGERHAQAVAKVEKLKAELAAAEADELRGRVALAAAKVKADQVGEPLDLEPIRRELAAVESTNAKVRQVKARTLKLLEVKELKEKADRLTEKLDALDKAKADAIAAAKLPVPGLTLGENGVLLGGVPFSQCSGAERLRTSVAIGLALNPKLRLMLIRDGSLLDADGMRILAEMAESADAQVLIERVQSAGEVGVLIEDGAVVESREVVTA